MINYIVSNSYGVGDALMTLNTIFLFEKNKNREITISFHQRDNEKTKFNFLNISNIFSYFFLKPISLNCHIKYESSSLESDEIGEENFKKGVRNYFAQVNKKYKAFKTNKCILLNPEIRLIDNNTVLVTGIDKFEGVIDNENNDLFSIMGRQSFIFTKENNRKHQKRSESISICPRLGCRHGR